MAYREASGEISWDASTVSGAGAMSVVRRSMLAASGLWHRPRGCHGGLGHGESLSSLNSCSTALQMRAICGVGCRSRSEE